MGSSLATKADGIHALAMAWLDFAMGFMNNIKRKKAYQEISRQIQGQKGNRIFSYNYGNGIVGYIKNPGGILVEEWWRINPDSPLKSFIRASIFGYGSTAGSAFIQGRNQTRISIQDEQSAESRFVFIDLLSLRIMGPVHYMPEYYTYSRSTDYLHRTLFFD